jgi:hypothetical protein
MLSAFSVWRKLMTVRLEVSHNLDAPHNMTARLKGLNTPALLHPSRAYINNMRVSQDNIPFTSDAPMRTKTGVRRIIELLR